MDIYLSIWYLTQLWSDSYQKQYWLKAWLTSKMCFTNNRLTGLRADKTWLDSTRLSRLWKFGQGSQGDYGGLCGKGDQGGRWLHKDQPQVDYKKDNYSYVGLVWEVMVAWVVRAV